VLTHVSAELPPGLVPALRRVGARAYLELPPVAQNPTLLQFLKTEHVEPLVPALDPRRPFEPFAVALGAECEVRLLWPDRRSSSSPPAPRDTAVVRVDFRKTSVLLVGDAEARVHQKLLERSVDLRATLLQVASNAPTSDAWRSFAEAVHPKGAVATGHVSSGRAALVQLEGTGVALFRTDLDGELHVESDGETMSVRSERPAAGEAPGKPHVLTGPVVDAGTPRKVAVVKPQPPKSEYVASRNSNVFHRPTCHTVKKIASKNLLMFTTRVDAEKERKPAQDCSP
jgi:competence protein ComEC